MYQILNIIKQTVMNLTSLNSFVEISGKIIQFEKEHRSYLENGFKNQKASVGGPTDSYIQYVILEMYSKHIDYRKNNFNK